MDENFFDIENSKLDLCAYISIVIVPPILFVLSEYLEPIRGDYDIHDFATLVFVGSYLILVVLRKDFYFRILAVGMVWAVGVGLVYAYLPLFVCPVYFVFPLIWLFRNRQKKK